MIDIKETDQAGIYAYHGASDGKIYVFEGVVQPSSEITTRLRVFASEDLAEIQSYELNDFTFKRIDLGVSNGESADYTFASDLSEFINYITTGGYDHIIYAGPDTLFILIQATCGGCQSALAKIGVNTRTITVYSNLSALGFFVEDAPYYVVRTDVDTYHLLDYNKNSLKSLTQEEYEIHRKNNVRFLKTVDNTTGNHLYTDLATGTVHTIKRDRNGGILEFLPKNSFILEKNYE